MAMGLSMVSGFALAGGSSVGEESLRYGILVAETDNDVRDPVAATRRVSRPNPLNAVAAIPFGRDRRIYAQLFDQSFATVASNSRGTAYLGEDVKRVGVDVSLQWRQRWSYRWQPWLGVGLGFANTGYTRRFTITPDGYLAATYPDLSETALDLVVNAATHWRLTGHWTTGVLLQYEYPVNGNTSVLTAGITVMY